MNIIFYAPFKPLGHDHPSGDLVTASGIVDYLRRQGHRVVIADDLRCRWIYWKPWRWPLAALARRRVERRFSRGDVDLWLTYHTYYKAPDVLGPAAAAAIGIPYVVFQGIYSTKRRRRLKTMPGFYLNKKALCAARHVFTNKKVDEENLHRLLPATHVTYITPGLIPAQFAFDAGARGELRGQWGVEDDPVVLSVAMFRPGVKAEGLRRTIDACGGLLARGRRLWLVIAGDGSEKDRLAARARDRLDGRVRFVGRVPRLQLYRLYSAADVFAFPGINESLGMVYLEAQSCGLPVVACANAGVPEAVADGRTGLLVSMDSRQEFEEAIERLLMQPELRRRMGEAARRYVREVHDLDRNYRKMEEVLAAIAGRVP